MSSLRDAILAADDLTSEILEIPEWGVTVEVRTPTAGDRARLFKIGTTADGTVDPELLYPMLLVSTVCDPDTHESLFTLDDAEALNAKSGAVVERVANVAMRLSGMTPDAVDEGKGDS